MKSTFIKLDRNILSWRWYKDGNTFRVFLHLLLTANVKPAAFRDVFIDRGELLTSYDSVANTLNLSKPQVRTAFRHLLSTGAITVRKTSKTLSSIVSVVNYELYQGKQHSKQMKSTFIMLDRNILGWRYYKVGNTFRVFLHFLLTANVKPAAFRAVFIDRGELLTNYNCVINTLNLSLQNVRTAFRHLKSTGEITVTKYSKFSIVSVVNYEMYQSKQHGKQHSDQHSANTQPTVCEHHIKNIKNERIKEIYKALGVTDENVLVALAEYEEMRGQKRKPLTDSGRQRLLQKLKDITTDTVKQVRLLHKATDGCWLSVFDDGNPTSKRSLAEASKYDELLKQIIHRNEEDD